MPERSNRTEPVGAGRRGGRRPITNRTEVELAAFALFDRHGFEQTTIDDIAGAAGISRRTFFRYFPSKNDVPWGSFDERLDIMRADFRLCDPETPLMDALREVVVGFNAVPDAEQRRHRRRLSLILSVPALQAHSTLRFADWRRVVAEFAGARLGDPATSLVPQAIAHASLGVAIAAYEHWLAHPAAELGVLLDRALRELGTGFPGIAENSRMDNQRLFG